MQNTIKKNKPFVHFHFFLLIFTLIFFVLLFIFTYPNPKQKFEKEFREKFISGQNLKTTYETALSTIGTSTTMAILEKRPFCHSEEHDLGRVIYDRSKNLHDALLVCGNSCNYGCYHGVISEALTRTTGTSTEGRHFTSEDLKKHVDFICDENYGYRTGNCAHALGHAFVNLSNYKIPESLQNCKAFIDRRFEYYCASGVFMEYGLKYGNSERGADLLKPCDEFPDEYGAACFRYKPWYLLFQLGSFDLTLKECEKLAGRSRIGCFHGLGLAYAVDIAKNPSLLAKVCASSNDDEKRVCIEGAVELIATEDENEAHRACNTLAGSWRNFCVVTAKNGIYTLDKPTLALYFPLDSQ